MNLFNPFVSRKDKQEKINDEVKKIEEQQPEQEFLFNDLEQNCRYLRQLFADNDTIVCREICNAHNSDLEYRLFYSEGMIDEIQLNDNAICPLIQSPEKLGREPAKVLIEKVITLSSVTICTKWDELINSLSYGEAILFLPHGSKALILDVKDFKTRNISEPDSEKILQGPREGFNESLCMNLTLLRRKLRTNDLKLRYRTFGRRTQTRACICYMDSLVNKRVLKELESRLDTIDIDGVFDTNYLTELIRDSSLSPFRTTGYTERPDVAAAKLLEGRIAIFLDGTPAVLTVPYLFIENFQSSEDYYLNYFYTSFSRMLRILGFLLTVMVPGFYVAVVAFHHEMLPTPLLINIASERQGVPLPAAAEAFIMLIVFDILRETGLRMPSNIGQALSIVGALVIGQAAVEAKLVAAPMIIIVGLTGITALLVPKMNSPIVFVRLFILTASSILGLFGMMLAFSTLIIHMLNLDSFGVSQLTPTGQLKFQDIKDKPFRAPMWKMVTRPYALTQNTIRLNTNKKEKP